MTLLAVAIFACVVVSARFYPLLERLVRVRERRQDLADRELDAKIAATQREIEARKTEALEPMPEDLASWAAQWGDKFARDSTIASMWEMKKQLGTWDMVRLHYHLSVPPNE